MLVDRDDDRLLKRIPLPFVDPISILRRWVALGGMVQRVIYADTAAAAGPHGFLTVELRDGAKPLLDFAAPTSQPTSAPTSAPIAPPGH